MTRALQDTVVDAPDLEMMARLGPRLGRSFSAGEVLFREGERSDEAFLIQAGRVRVVKRVRQTERSLNIARVGELIGESALVDGSPRTQTAIAVSDGAALVFDRASFKQAVAEFPLLGARICEQMISRVRDAEDQIEVMMLRDAQSKIVSALIKLTRGQDASALLELSPVELSARVGVDVDTVKRTVLRLREQQYLRIVGEKVEILDLDALKRLYTLLGSKEELRG